MITKIKICCGGDGDDTDRRIINPNFYSSLFEGEYPPKRVKGLPRRDRDRRYKK
jgi:hypothetical protein